MNSRRNLSYSPNISMPGSTSQRSNRGLWAFLLTLLIPPVGLMYMWRNGVFQSRGRILLTAVATLEMAVLIVMFTPSSELVAKLPTPGVPGRIGPAPESDVLTALSNMDQLLREQQGSVGNENAFAVNPVAQEERLAAQQDVLSTVVYAFNSSTARYYHVAPNCGEQENTRMLTILEAVGDGMGACPICNPPAYTYKVESETE